MCLQGQPEERTAQKNLQHETQRSEGTTDFPFDRGPWETLTSLFPLLVSRDSNFKTMLADKQCNGLSHCSVNTKIGGLQLTKQIISHQMNKRKEQSLARQSPVKGGCVSTRGGWALSCGQAGGILFPAALRPPQYMSIFLKKKRRGGGKKSVAST